MDLCHVYFNIIINETEYYNICGLARNVWEEASNTFKGPCFRRRHQNAKHSKRSNRFGRFQCSHTYYGIRYKYLYTNKDSR